MRPRRIVIGGVVAGLLIGGYLLRFPPGPRPLCHRMLDGAFQQWMLETHATNAFYPNVNGDGSASLAMIQRYSGNDDIQEYGYVPGLRIGDPKDLVFMYLKKKTRHSWHADTDHSIFSPQRWMAVSPGIVDLGTCPEGGDLLTTPEFKKRLQLTLNFLKENNRPYWQAVTDEQSKFLKSIKE